MLVLLLATNGACQQAEPCASPQGGRASCISSVIYVERCAEPEPKGDRILQADVRQVGSGSELANTRVLYESPYFGAIQELSVSPSGTALLASVNTTNPAYTDLTDIWRIPVSGGKPEAVRGDGAGYTNLQWSSDESMISYSSSQGTPSGPSLAPPSDLYAQSLKPGTRVKLLSGAMSAQWIPGQHVLVATSFRKAGVFVFSANGSRSAVVPGMSEGGTLIVSPNGRGVLWVRLKRIRVLEPPADARDLFNAAEWRVAGTFDLPERPEMAAWSPDGKRLALVVAVFGSGPAKPRQITVLDPESRTVRALGTVKGVFGGLRWSKDGRYLVFSHRLESGLEIAAIAADAGDRQPIKNASWLNDKAASAITLVRLPANATDAHWTE